MQRHMKKHSNSNFAPVISMSQEKCQRFQLVHPFICVVAGMTGSGKNCLGTITVTTNSNRDGSTTGENNLVLFTVVARLHAWIINDETNNGICQRDPRISGKWFLFRCQHTQPDYMDDQMIEAGKDNRIVNLFTKGSHHRNLSVIYIVQNLFHQGKGNRSISLNSHYLVLFKNPRDKLQILTLAEQIVSKWNCLVYQRVRRGGAKTIWISICRSQANDSR